MQGVHGTESDFLSQSHAARLSVKGSEKHGLSSKVQSLADVMHEQRPICHFPAIAARTFQLVMSRSDATSSFNNENASR